MHRPHDIYLQQAQIATAAERLPHADTERVFAALAKAALASEQDAGQAWGAVRTAVETSSGTPDFEDVISHKGLDEESVAIRAELLGNFDRFAPAVAELKERVGSGTDKDLDDGRVGRGAWSTVYPITVDGEVFMVRLRRNGQPNPTAVDEHLAAEVLRRQLSPESRRHMEHIVAGSYAESVTVARPIKGRTLDLLTPEELLAIPDQYLEDALDAVIEGHGAGLRFDPKASNLFVDMGGAGITLLDHTSARIVKEFVDEANLSTTIFQLASVLSTVGFAGKPQIIPKTPESYAHDLSYFVVHQVVIERYRALVARKMTGEDRDEALRLIDSSLKIMRETIVHYSDPQWVADTIAKNAAYRARVGL